MCLYISIQTHHHTHTHITHKIHPVPPHTSWLSTPTPAHPRTLARAHTHIQTYTNTNTHTRTNTYTHTNAHTYTPIYTRTNTHPHSDFLTQTTCCTLFCTNNLYLCKKFTLKQTQTDTKTDTNTHTDTVLPVNWVMSHTWICHVIRMKQPCHTYQWVLFNLWTSHVTHMIDSCYTYNYVMSRIRIRHVTHVNESCCTYNTTHGTHEWVMAHTRISRHPHKGCNTQSAATHHLLQHTICNSACRSSLYFFDASTATHRNTPQTLQHTAPHRTKPQQCNSFQHLQEGVQLVTVLPVVFHKWRDVHIFQNGVFWVLAAHFLYPRHVSDW